MNYQDAKGVMSQHKANVDGKKGVMAKVTSNQKAIGNSTWLCHRGATGVHQEHYDVVLFGNTIIEFYEDFFDVDDHSWFGKTTHERLNEFMPRGFSVWGTKYNYLTKPRPLGFVKTPISVFPYAMPMTFTYGGALQKKLPAYCADDLIKALPESIDYYLRKLFSDEKDGLSYDMPLFEAPLAERAVEFSDLQYNGLTIQEIVEVLMKSGASAFAKTTRARHMESLLIHGKAIPIINKNWLRKTLRPLIHDFAIESMGFAEVEWNRR